MQEIFIQELKEKLEKNKITVLKIGAEWCPACKSIEPIIHSIEEYYPNISFLKLEIQEDDIDIKNFLKENKIMSIPTLLFYKNGEYKNRLIGFVSENKLRSFIDENILD